MINENKNKSQKERLIAGIFALVLAGIIIFFTIPYFQIMKDAEVIDSSSPKALRPILSDTKNSSDIKVSNPSTAEKVPMKNLVTYFIQNGEGDIKKALKISVEKEMLELNNNDNDLVLSIDFDVTNQTEKDIEVHHANSRDFGYIIYDRNGEKLYDDIITHVYTMAFTTSKFPVNEKKEFSVKLKEKELPFKISEIGNIEAFIPDSEFKLNIKKNFSF